jgi:single-strand DNA-binding protein
MASFNKVILMGNLTRDPELRYTPKGTAIARIGIAVNRVWKTETGESKEEVTFVDCDAYGKTGETIGQYLKKGSPVLIEGRLRLHTWEDKNTKQKQSKLRVDVENFKFVGPANREGGAPAPSRPAPAPASEAPDAEPPAEHDDVPF